MKELLDITRLQYTCPVCGSDIDIWLDDFEIYCVFCGTKFRMTIH